MRDFLTDLAIVVVALVFAFLIVFGMDKLLFGKFVHVQECIPMVIGFDSTYYDMGNAALDVNAFVTRGELSELNQEIYEKNIAPGQFGDITVYFGEDAVHLTYYNTYDLDITTGLAKVTSITTSASGINVNGIAVGDDVQTVIDKMGEPSNEHVNSYDNIERLSYFTKDDKMRISFYFDNNGYVKQLCVDNYGISKLHEEFTIAPQPKY